MIINLRLSFESLCFRIINLRKIMKFAVRDWLEAVCSSVTSLFDFIQHFVERIRVKGGYWTIQDTSTIRYAIQF